MPTCKQVLFILSLPCLIRKMRNVEGPCVLLFAINNTLQLVTRIADPTTLNTQGWDASIARLTEVPSVVEEMGSPVSQPVSPVSQPVSPVSQPVSIAYKISCPV